MPGIPIATGSGIAAAGVGLNLLMQPNNIHVTVPAGATVKQVLLYYAGRFNFAIPGIDTVINVNGTDVAGTLIGGPTVILMNQFGTVHTATYRADITSLGVVGPGANVVTVGGLAFGFAEDGAGVLVIYDDGTTSNIQVRDGNDFAFLPFAPPGDTTVPQTFNFASSPVARTARLAMFFSSVVGSASEGGGPPVPRSTRIKVTVNGTTTQVDNVLASNDGQEWDTLNLDVDIPAGETNVTVQACSGPGPNNPASFTWHLATLSAPTACSGSISGKVFCDKDWDCRLDAGEPGLSGVKVTLKNSAGQMVCTTTDTNGCYRFDNLAAGQYWVKVPWWVGTKVVCGKALLDPRIGQCEQKTDVNFGFKGPKVSVGDDDDDGDGDGDDDDADGGDGDDDDDGDGGDGGDDDDGDGGSDDDDD
jgi:hypothetical protein